VASKSKRLANKKERAETECPVGNSASDQTGDRQEHNAKNKREHTEDAYVVRRNQPGDISFVPDLGLSLKAPFEQRADRLRASRGRRCSWSKEAEQDHSQE